MNDDIAIDLSLDIIPGKSIGGISLGDNANDVMQHIGNTYSVDTFEFSNNMGVCCLYRINGGAISFTSDEDDIIIALWCEPPYQGSYEKKLYPGITAGELRENSRRQEIVKGYLVIDRNFSIYYGMPDDIDDFNFFSDLDDDVVFNELYVGELK